MPAPNDPDNDPFHPPKTPVQVHCIHCDQEYESYLIEWRLYDGPDGPQGFWCCPIPGCDGKGFGFDIFPTDPDYRDEHGNLMWVDDGYEEEDSDAAHELDPTQEQRRNGNGKGNNGHSRERGDQPNGDIPF